MSEPCHRQSSAFLCARLQAFSSETGRLLDDFTLTKPANYHPNITARNDFLASGFQSTYQPPFYEVRALPLAARTAGA